MASASTRSAVANTIVTARDDSTLNSRHRKVRRHKGDRGPGNGNGNGNGNTTPSVSSNLRNSPEIPSPGETPRCVLSLLSFPSPQLHIPERQKRQEEHTQKTNKIAAAPAPLSPKMRPPPTNTSSRPASSPAPSSVTSAAASSPPSTIHRASLTSTPTRTTRTSMASTRCSGSGYVSSPSLPCCATSRIRDTPCVCRSGPSSP